METETRSITPDELAELKQLELTKQQLHANLGVLTRQASLLQKQIDSVHAEFDSLEREQQHVNNRMIRKYNFGQNTQINPETGEIVEQ